MPERIDIIGLISAISIALYAFAVKQLDNWLGKKTDKFAALEELLLKTNNGKDLLEHLDEAKERKLTAKQESEDIRAIIKAFPDFLHKLEALTKSVDHLDNNIKNNQDPARFYDAVNKIHDRIDLLKK